jgi:hypothetical protein
MSKNFIPTSNAQQLTIVKQMLSGNTNSILGKYNNLESIILALSEIDDLLTFFQIKVIDGHVYLYPSLMLADYIFITKIVYVNNAIRLYNLKAELEEEQESKRIKIIQN